MEWRIRQSAHGYIAEKGATVQSQPNPFGLGYIMPAFIVYESCRFDTLAQARNYVKRKSN